MFIKLYNHDVFSAQADITFLFYLKMRLASLYLCHISLNILRC